MIFLRGYRILVVKLNNLFQVVPTFGMCGAIPSVPRTLMVRYFSIRTT